MEIKAEGIKGNSLAYEVCSKLKPALGAGSPKFKSEMGKELPVVLGK